VVTKERLEKINPTVKKDPHYGRNNSNTRLDLFFLSPNASSGTTYGSPPLRLSVQGTRHHLNNFVTQLLAAPIAKGERIYCTLLKVIAHKAVPDRPGRSEARVRKRRPNAYPFMTKPRHEFRKQLQTV